MPNGKLYIISCLEGGYSFMVCYSQQARLENRDFLETVPPNGTWHTSPVAQQMGLPAARALAAPKDSKKAM